MLLLLSSYRKSFTGLLTSSSELCLIQMFCKIIHISHGFCSFFYAWCCPKLMFCHLWHAFSATTFHFPLCLWFFSCKDWYACKKRDYRRWFLYPYAHTQVVKVCTECHSIELIFSKTTTFTICKIWSLKLVCKVDTSFIAARPSVKSAFDVLFGLGQTGLAGEDSEFLENLTLPKNDLTK